MSPKVMIFVKDSLKEAKMKIYGGMVTNGEKNQKGWKGKKIFF